VTTSAKKILAAILCFGFIYRVISLGRRQLWTDELLQALVARSSPLSELLSRLRDGVPLPAPLDFQIQRFFISILGESSWALRFHAVVLSTLSLWLFYRIGNRLFGTWVALYSTALLALYPLHYHYSQEGRPYALVLLLTLASFDLLLEKLAGRNDSWKGWAAQTLVLVLVLYSSLLGILVLFAELSCLMASRFLKHKAASAGGSAVGDGEAPDLPAATARHIVSYTVAAGLACAVFVPWAKFIWGSPAIPGATPAVRFRFLWELLRGMGDNSLFVTSLLLLGLVPGLRALSRHGRPRALLLLTVWSGAIVLGIVVTDFWSAGWYPARYLLLVAPPLVLVAGYGMAHVGERLAILDRLPFTISSPAIAYIAVLLISSGWIAQSRWRNEPVDWKGTADFLNRALRPGDTAAMPETHPLLEYYAPSLEEFRVNDLSPEPVSTGRGGDRRRFVVCLNGLSPDPCAGFRQVALKDRAWRRIEFLKGFTVYMRDR
jgi:hypothetical protein